MSSGGGPSLAHRSVASIRSAPNQRTPSTPHTPPRPISTSYGSPSTVRADDDIIVIELGSRSVKVGFAGDSLPKAELQCGPQQQRRVGDFRAWASETKTPGQAWCREFEIWRYDLRDVELGLVHDKLDRLLRDAFTKYLLIDSRPRRMALCLDTSLPTPLLSTVLDTTFLRFQTPMVSLLSSAAMAAVAAGVRSALVIDVGWAETVVTSVYEYREVKNTRTVRAGRHLLNALYRKALRPLISGESGEDLEEQSAANVLSFEETEDIMCRLMWCRPSAFRSSQRDSAQLETVEEQDEEADPSHAQAKGTTQIRLETSNPPSKTIEVSFEKIADVCDDAFFEPSAPATSFDDHELPLHTLVYRHLLQLPIDARAICMSRIIFTGGCSNILGLKERVVDEVTTIVERRGWEPVTGKGADAARASARLSKQSATTSPQGAASPSSEADETQSETSAATAAAEPELDPIERKLQGHRKQRPPVQGQIRALHSLGPWAGASLTSHLKVPALATIDRELWLQQGASGASRPGDVDQKAQSRQSVGAGGLIRGSGGHHTNWTLGAWGTM